MEDNYYDVLNMYYKFKGDYEEQYNQAKQKIRKKKDMSNEEKRELIKKIKRKCLNCDQVGGMLFTHENRVIKGICNAKTPCKFNIELNLERSLDSRDDLAYLKDDLDDKMEQIILRKLHLLFELEDESVTIDEFNKLKPEYVELKNSIDEIEEINDKTKEMKDPETGDIILRSEMYNKVHDEMMDKINDFKDLLKKAKLTENSNQKRAFIKEAIDINIIHIIQKQQFLRNIKYKYSDVEKTPIEIINPLTGLAENRDFNVLIQRKNLVSAYDYIDEDGGVVSNIYEV